MISKVPIYRLARTRKISVRRKVEMKKIAEGHSTGEAPAHRSRPLKLNLAIVVDLQWAGWNGMYRAR